MALLELIYSKETEQGQEWDKNGTGTKHFGRNK